ncbi:hypothetical protein BJ508DRAFT_415857 [Ascobolus immersus RN42]|uniref:F-box domain-containing protein n=1 Tax=Ascobolus immersus RN42 TaxID=1160509 RepID=A0A3N4I608_ASCIM|nr:hypothetical protein BJ508DRAFT_415857 [Ascobolus immersus RN42]
MDQKAKQAIQPNIPEISSSNSASSLIWLPTELILHINSFLHDDQPSQTNFFRTCHRINNIASPDRVIHHAHLLKEVIAGTHSEMQLEPMVKASTAKLKEILRVYGWNDSVALEALLKRTVYFLRYHELRRYACCFEASESRVTSWGGVDCRQRKLWRSHVKLLVTQLKALGVCELPYLFDVNRSVPSTADALQADMCMLGFTEYQTVQMIWDAGMSQGCWTHQFLDRLLRMYILHDCYKSELETENTIRMVEYLVDGKGVELVCSGIRCQMRIMRGKVMVDDNGDITTLSRMSEALWDVFNRHGHTSL